MKPIIRDVGMILAGMGIAVIGYLGLTGALTYNPIPGAGLITLAIIFAYSLGKRVSTHQRGISRLDDLGSSSHSLFTES